MIYWIAHIALVSTLSLVIFKFSKVAIASWIFWSALILKLLAGIVLGLVFYEYYGYGDSIAFFEAAKTQQLHHLANQPRTLFFVKLLIPIVKLSGESYWISSIILSFISFASCLYLMKTFSSLYPELKNIIIVCFLFTPSVIFWSSGIMKDTLTFSAVAIIIAILHKFYHTQKVNAFELLFLIASGFILLRLKHYLFITVIIYASVLLSIITAKKFANKWKWGAVCFLLIASFTIIQHVHPYLNVNRLAWVLYQNNKSIIQKSDPAKSLDLQIEDDSWSAVLKELPKAIHVGLFRPSFLDKVPPMGFIHQLENMIISTLIILSIILLLKEKHLLDKPLIISAISCILLLAALLPLSTPNFGTLVRYKNAYMPFLLLLSSILPYKYLFNKEG